jgi:flavin-binding protein dodecin
VSGVAVQKSVELVAEGGTVEDAVGEALDRAGMTLDGITSFEVRRITGRVEDGRALYRVELSVWFTLLERLHG